LADLLHVAGLPRSTFYYQCQATKRADQQRAEEARIRAVYDEHKGRYGYPLAVRTDNGPEFTSRAFMGWTQTHGIRHILIEPGRPMQNGYIESLNGKFRDECLNEQWFETLAQARSAITAWRQDYNEVRPHSSCNRMRPAKFAELHRQRADDAARPSSNTTTEIN